MDTGQQRQLEEMALYKNIYRWIRKTQVVGMFNAYPSIYLVKVSNNDSENARQWTKYPPLQFYLRKYLLPINTTQ
jgi:hypothetical protein